MHIRARMIIPSEGSSTNQLPADIAMPIFKFVQNGRSK